MRVIRGRRAVVTGAASGIGRAIALALAAEGAHVFLLDRDAEPLTEVAQDIRASGVEAEVTACDLAVPAEITEAMARVRAVWSDLHIVVNCAGVMPFGAFHLMSDEAWRHTLAVNLLAPMQVVRELLETLQRVDEAHIVNVCSFVGLVPARKVPVYQTSKHGLVGFTLGLRYEYYGETFGVTALCPGFVRTPMLQHITGPEAHNVPVAGVPNILSTTAEAVAAKTIAAIRRNKGIVTITPFARVAWWLWRLSPGFVDWFLREGCHRVGRMKLLAPRKPAP
jgi:short-subunit dehydrogenase